MMIVSFNTMITYLTMDCSDGTIDTALYAVFLIDTQRWSCYDIFMFRNIHMVDWRYFNEIFIPFIPIYYLRNYAGICVDTSHKSIESKQLHSYQDSGHDIRIKLAMDHIIGHHDRWNLNYKQREENRYNWWPIYDIKAVTHKEISWNAFYSRS